MPMKALLAAIVRQNTSRSRLVMNHSAVGTAAKLGAYGLQKGRYSRVLRWNLDH